MNTRKILNWMTRGWNPFLLWILCLFAFLSTGFLPYNFWLRGVLVLPLLASCFLVVETLPGGMLDPERKARNSLKAEETPKVCQKLTFLERDVTGQHLENKSKAQDSLKPEESLNSKGGK